MVSRDWYGEMFEAVKTLNEAMSFYDEQGFDVEINCDYDDPPFIKIKISKETPGDG